MPALGWAVLTMAVVILVVDQFFWRPIVARRDKFRLDQSAALESPQSWVLRHDAVSRASCCAAAPLGERTIGSRRGLDAHPAAGAAPQTVSRPALVDRAYDVLLIGIVGALAAIGFRFVSTGVGFPEVFRVVGLGAATLLRVRCVLMPSPPSSGRRSAWPSASRRRLARVSSRSPSFWPSFPANFIFPFATLAFIRFGVSLNYGSMLLMALGAQWYILFNVIAGAASIPTDLREMADDIGSGGAALAAADRARHLLGMGDGGDHGERRGVEREHRFGSRELGLHDAHGDGARRLHRRGHRQRRLAAHHPRGRHHERLRRRYQSRAVEAVVRARGKEVPPVTEDLIVATAVGKSFPTPDGKGQFTVLADVDVAVARRRGRRAPGPQRQREEHAAADHGRL